MLVYLLLAAFQAEAANSTWFLLFLWPLQCVVNINLSKWEGNAISNTQSYMSNPMVLTRCLWSKILTRSLTLLIYGRKLCHFLFVWLPISVLSCGIPYLMNNCWNNGLYPDVPALSGKITAHINIRLHINKSLHDRPFSSWMVIRLYVDSDPYMKIFWRLSDPAFKDLYKLDSWVDVIEVC